jgi:tetratricopeptide (TPR) repeat protein
LSRSRHVTHAALRRLEKEDFSRPERRAELMEELREEMREKRAAKAAVRRERRRGSAHRAPTPADLVPVRVSPGAPFVHHPAGEDDVREVLRRLPPGVLDGLAAIDLHPGMETQAESAEEDGVETDGDPHTGRRGHERYPGVWVGRVLGRYRAWAAEIELYAFVHDPAHPLRWLWEPILRLEALATLAHEVAHHHDHTCRVARGRWTARGTERVERYAEARQHEWTHAVIVPYLRERYAGEIREVERWIERHGGIALPFEALAGDPRVTLRGGKMHATRLVFPMHEAVSHLIRDVDQGRPAWECRLGFARELHFQDRFGEALEIVDGLLLERPDDREIRIDRADFLVHLGRHAEALEMAEALTAEDPSSAGAWEVMVNACKGLERWPAAVDAATRLLELAEAAGDRWETTMALRQRADAFIRAGDFAAARADAARIEVLGGMQAKRAARLRAEIDAAEQSTADG